MFSDGVLALVRLSSRELVRREEERVEKVEMVTSESSGTKKARIRMSLGEDTRGRRIA